MSVEFKEVSFRNFMSFGNTLTTVDLTSHKVSLLIGENLDEGGSSGSGKTTLINAISYALFDKVPSKISKDKLINRTNDDKKTTLMEVNLSFSKDSDEYVIRRTRGEKVSMQCLKNGIDVTTALSSNFNAEIIRIIGMTFELFCTTVLFRGKATPFLDLPVSRQRSVIEELFKITTLSAKARSLQLAIGDSKKNVEVLTAVLNQKRAQQKQHEASIIHISNLIDKWEMDKASKIAALEKQKQDSKQINFVEEEELLSEREELRKRSKVVAVQLSEINSNLKNIEGHLQSLEGDLSHLTNDKCPFCLQKFSSEEKVAELKTSIKEVSEGIKLQKIDSEALTTQLTEAKLQETEITSVVRFSSIQDLIRAKTAAEFIDSKIKELESTQNPHIQVLERLAAEDGLIIDDSELNEAAKLLEHQQFLLKILTDKNSFIRKSIINRAIPHLNKQLSTYVKKLNLPHIVKFMPDMSCEISQYSRQLDHGNLSDGEQIRLNIAISMSFRDVQTFLHDKVNVLFTDEIDGGSLCQENIRYLAELIKAKAWTDKIGIFCISHSIPFQDSIDNHIIVRKEHGFSSIT